MSAKLFAPGRIARQLAQYAPRQGTFRHLPSSLSCDRIRSRLNPFITAEHADLPSWFSTSRDGAPGSIERTDRAVSNDVKDAKRLFAIQNEQHGMASKGKPKTEERHTVSKDQKQLERDNPALYDAQAPTLGGPFKKTGTHASAERRQQEGWGSPGVEVSDTF